MEELVAIGWLTVKFKNIYINEEKLNEFYGFGLCLLLVAYF